MKISKLFTSARQQGRKLFIPYITCGDPSLIITEQLVIELAAAGADIIELGVPFSDPLADGPTNQLAAQRALRNQVSLADCCKLVAKLRAKACHIPIVLFTYYNPVLQLGLESFAQLARISGIDAVLAVDLPVEEAAPLISALSSENIGTIFLVAPTTSAERIKKSSQAATEFLYYVSRTGVTGTQTALSTSLEQELKRVRALTDLPIAIGFGISTTAQAARAAQFADAVVVGSALVKIMENADSAIAVRQLINQAAEFAAAIKGF